MRFTENGPSIPDELLNARDEGRVVVFCGAGVSQARAGLPDFFGLAESVIRELGVAEDSDARKVLNKAREIAEEISVAGLISADRVFGLLEREFTAQNIQAEVAKSLKPKADVVLSAHQLLLRLATTPDSKTQLVTTNFDRLFDQCDGNRKVFQPPQLLRHDDLDGIVYLHGRVNNDYTGAEGDGFVLSSSDFGHAYLSEGWATEFFLEIIRKHVVVFIGYSADDPPIHYLLEGLRKSQGSPQRIYAFQDGEPEEAIPRWSHKGVEAIPYSPSIDHTALWDTLEHWARRADDPELWRRNVLDLAMDGPANLKPHQRGQLAHIVSTDVGAREFAEREPPAEWLCVFDPMCRYARPEQLNRFDPDGTIIDPFSLYGLDSDVTPERGDPNNPFARPDIPADAWNVLHSNKLDRQNPPDESFSSVRGHFAVNIPQLPKRLNILSTWIASVANQPAAVWWVARQKSLHPDIRHSIEWNLAQRHEDFPAVIQKAWRYLLEAREHTEDKPRSDWYDLKREIDRDGWSLTAVRRFSAINCPYLKAGTGATSRPSPPSIDTNYRLQDLVKFEVVCPVPADDANIPDEWLKHVICGLRKNIELAVQLSEEVDDNYRFHISPITEDKDPNISDYGRKHGLSACVITFAKLFDRLLELDVSLAKEEFSTWPKDDETAFARLRLWASGKEQMATPHAFSQVVMGVSDDVFWSDDHQRDLLLVLKYRWSELSERARKRIENRLLGGPKQWKGEDDNSFKEHKAGAVLQRLQWLADNDCEFSFDVAEEIAKRRADIPRWKPEHADRSAESREIRSGFVGTNTGHDALLREPIASVLSKARELSGRSEENSFEELDPFAGLCAERPKRAYLALAHAAKEKEYPVWAWKTFLNPSRRENDIPKFSATIAARLCRLPDKELSKLIYPAAWWFQKISKSLSSDCPSSFDNTLERLIDVLRLEPSENRSNIIITNRGRDWLTEAINSQTGHVVRAILNDLQIEADEQETAQFTRRLKQLQHLLSLPSDPGRYAIAVVSQHLGWFHRLDSEWTEQYLQSILEAEDDQYRESLWAGIFWNPKISSPDLYLRLKAGLMEVAKSRSTSREGHFQSVAFLVVLGWISTDGNKGQRWVSNAEFRDVLLHGGDEFRSHVLWQIQNGLCSDDSGTRKEWQEDALEFFNNVWPRQKTVKNSIITQRLCEFLVSHIESFPVLIDSVLPLLTQLRDARGLHIHFRSEAGDTIKAHPERFLQLLSVVLPDEVKDWPYGIGDVLEMIGGANSSLLSDARLLELMRKWNAR